MRARGSAAPFYTRKSDGTVSLGGNIRSGQGGAAARGKLTRAEAVAEARCCRQWVDIFQQVCLANPHNAPGLTWDYV